MRQEWNALYVRHNHEKAASRFLAAHGVDHYLPLCSEQSEWSNRCKVVVERPVFPGYVFVCFTPEQRKLVLRAPGVVCLAGERDKFGTITDTDIQRIREAIALGYVRISGEHCQHSTNNQLNAVCCNAKACNIEIVRTYLDRDRDSLDELVDK
jgi:transcription antitermination factor NusG